MVATVANVEVEEAIDDDGGGGIEPVPGVPGVGGVCDDDGVAFIFNLALFPTIDKKFLLWCCCCCCCCCLLSPTRLLLHSVKCFELLRFDNDDDDVVAVAVTVELLLLFLFLFL